ncbi:MAG: 30S ribosomal protein S6 [Candidatus Edwardsbacteria bacterium RIFOXYD12_FULL_50_11]|uniref:Small ribosomal subunit protein bS6 n=1 Tax=Candidatus Edwardsbacteria bacterium GWF2_54_11 TaxID=1817851 RepID=A0A1F5R786_9BACT|nr:MAG: 30S ribosomal protein S6 [Candidatus Edwardsbacteria bacterium RifOxyC12_full_54_24]OGF08253.1 MAG: 30S ribosomal protein S6 [Candidatus Edwardsbacteria bacterium RifOxyA12_full_54_48]OGF10304.1 MAG: 30S ribosomal protein S6 [Candidatus Edwardsbacteria bacterium GWF2_54_11]OGF11550.1 MAG: 30S ribosomal protein S6 [Candidatus Edwardsbacteria bacterium GWE2_54_12]OGF17337.1 MAG: 30S ribosomal protein S6 [Candidatus Edwardsbacteria bacterium RIFOXYD12_FULL_50_11]OGJ17204.1 MAG: 30S riboso
MNAYETVIILDPATDDAGLETEIQKVSELIKQQGGETVNVERWGRRKMAYPLNKRHDGNYLCIQFNAPAGAPKALDRICRLNENVVRHLIIKGHIATTTPVPVEAVPVESKAPAKGSE